MKKISLFSALCFLALAGQAQEPPRYQEPPKSIVELVDAPQAAQVQFNNDGSLMLLLEPPGLTSIEHVSQPVLGLAGLRVNPANNSTEGELQGVYKSVKLVDVNTGQEVEVSGLPMNLRMANIAWNPGGDKIAFSHNSFQGVQLWLIDVEQRQARRLGEHLLNDAYGKTLQWNPEGTQILAQLVPEERGNVPVKNPVPTGPVIQENLGVETPGRTYQNLLENAYDEQLMEYYLSSQLAAVDMDGTVEPIGEPAVYRSAAYSPDGKYLFIQRVQQPYSYRVPLQLFAFSNEILDAQGKLIKALPESPLTEDQPIAPDATTAGPRAYQWRADAPATLVWAEAKDGGDPSVEVQSRDAVFFLSAPFTGTARHLIDLELRYGGIEWIDKNHALVREQWRKSRKTRLSLIHPLSGKLLSRVSDRSSEDAYTDPGRFIRRPDQRGLLTARGKGPVVFTVGTGASAEGDRPFLLQWNLTTGKKDTLFKSERGYYEYPVYFTNQEKIFFSRESATQTPNYFVRDVKTKQEQALTSFADPYPGLNGVHKEQLSYKRKDGLTLSATLYLPAGYKAEDPPLPVLIWAYPREYKTKAAAGQVKGSAHRFTRLAFRSPVFWVTRGYAVLDEADMPIVGEGDQEPNDTFIEQIQDNAQALIDYIVERGIADRDRIAVGGHSYGAFMTANLLAHTDLFAAGIARSGAYNRTLTPFGFQAESRTFWQAPEVYARMSPFNYADKIKTPLLLTHGMDDENSGTFPVQSERMFSAIKGHGGTVRLVMLPKEFHGYRSRESVLHTFWEQDRWLEQYVKNREK